MSPDPRLGAGSRELRRLDVAMLCAAVASFGMLYATQALLPPIGAAFGVGPTSASLTVSAATGGLALALLPLSALAESAGRVRLMRTGLVTACALTFAAAAAPAFWLLVAVRVLVGVALGCVVAVAVAHIGSEVHPSVLGRTVGVYVAGNTLGGVGGRLVPGLVEGLGSWRVGVVAVGALAVVATVAFVRLLPAPRRSAPTRATWRHHRDAVRRVAGDGALVRLCLLAFVLMGGFVACYNYLTFRLESAPFGLGTGVASLVFLAYLAGTVSSPVAGRLSDRFGRRRLVLCSIGVALVGLAAMTADLLGLVVLGLVVFTGGFFAAHSVATSWVSTRAGAVRGQAAAAYLMSYYLGSSVLGAVLGRPYELGGWPATAAGVAALFLAGAVAVATVPARTR